MLGFFTIATIAAIKKQCGDLFCSSDFVYLCSILLIVLNLVLYFDLLHIERFTFIRFLIMAFDLISLNQNEPKKGFHLGK
jgi:hypothetical protein